MMWICIVIVFLSGAWSRDTGTNGNSSMTSNTTSPITVYVHREADFTVGSDVSLTCSNKTWNDAIYVIWNIELKHRSEMCTISYSDQGQSRDTCNDGKTVRNTSSGLSYLHIPNFSSDDVGIYMCEYVYRGGVEHHNITVTATVPPHISAWLEFKDNKMVAVCRAEGGNPAANISWTHTENLTVVRVERDTEGYFTVDNHLELPDDKIPENLTCIISHKSWEEDKILVPELRKSETSTNSSPGWLWPAMLCVISVLLVGISLFALKKLKMLKKCQQTDSAPSKPPPIHDVEEVEPYACYIQRVNSIYN